MSSAVGYSGKPLGELRSCRRGRPASSIALVAAILMAIWPSFEAKANCQDLINSDTYRCRVKDDDGGRFPDCFRFNSPGEQSEDFDLSIDQAGGSVGCDCKTAGTFISPKFGVANSFHCAGLDLAFEGAVRMGGRVIVGQAVSELGDSFFFRCTRNPNCALPVSTLGASERPWLGSE